MKRILIIQTAFLGDVILATPIASELKRIFPDSKIDFLVKKGNESLLSNNSNLNNIYVFDKKDGKIKNIFALIRTFRKSKYDLVVNLHRFGSSGLITALSGAKLKYGFKKNPFSFAFSKSFDHELSNGVHEVSRNLSLIKEFGAKDLVRPELFPGTEAFETVKKYDRTYFCMAPASIWYTKQMPKEKWVELIQRKASKGTVYLIGGPDDFDLCEEIGSKSGVDHCENLCGKLSLMESAALMNGAQMNYVNDSSPMHMASAMNAPVTAFFCSTVPEFGFTPLSENAVVKQVTSELECRPCGLHGYQSCPKGHFKCGEIDLEDL